MTTPTSGKSLWGAIPLLVVGTAMIVLCVIGWFGPSDSSLRVWLAGAMGLGLVTGLTTGMSAKEGSGLEFVKFISAGVLVPLLGGIGALMMRTEQVAEKSTYDGEKLLEKTTTTVVSLPEGALHPLSVLGWFFVGFALLAVVGVASGVLFRQAGLEVRAT